MTVLLLASRTDGQALLVEEALARRGAEPVWFETESFPLDAAVTAELVDDPDVGGWSTRFAINGGEIDSRQISAVFHRHSLPFVLPGEMSGPEQVFARTEARFGLGGLLAALDATWVSHPARMADAEYKPYQLKLARAAGLRVPPTLIASEPEAVGKFAADHGPLVYKPLMSSLIAEEGTTKLLYTNPVDLADVDESVRLTTHLFQPNLPKRYDVRLTATRHACFPIAIHTTDPGARQDWRTNYDQLEYEPIQAPAAIEIACAELLTKLGLEVGAFDFSVSPRGEWTYLEVNPCGAWAWLQAATAEPIAEAVADVLLGEPA